MTAQPIGSTPPPPSPAAAAQLRARIADNARADRWLPWFDLEWGQALEAARQSLDLGRVYDTLASWQRRLDTAPAVDRFVAGGCDTSDAVALEDILGPRR